MNPPARAVRAAVHSADDSDGAATSQKEIPMTDQSFQVTGLTCGHCVGSVTTAVSELSGVTDVKVDLVAGGTSTVHVTSAEPLSEAKVAAALDDAGAYELSNA